jgi:hypothetical protein
MNYHHLWNIHTGTASTTLKTGVDHTALVLNQVALYVHQTLRNLKEMPVMKMEIAAGPKLFNIMRFTIRNISYILIQNKEGVNALDIEDSVRIGSLDITENSVVCKNYLVNTVNLMSNIMNTVKCA